MTSHYSRNVVDRRGFISFSLRLVKVLAISFPIGFFSFPKTAVSWTDKSGKEISKNKLANKAYNLTNEWSLSARANDKEMTPSEIENQRKVALDAMQQILEQKGYHIKAPHSLRIID